ncbi:hypothetical protein SHI21_11210 [Bacteriovorax sp. PP10]|uniref:Lipoprotein n=1 Tax=Bacteriovorax antarcticus TaxID=3088717 RepID=A0ABU5VUR5_9BACT|nr:hypothetical protein [Bacteriovorax sp. PP10]MEA9356779.1 hypothetical protein [Bacteriovorax sp. PP10]
MKLTSLLIILSLFISSCANWERGVSTPFSSVSRLPASAVDEITYYLSVDKFKYYLNEYSVAQEGKIPDSIIAHLRGVTIEEIMNSTIDPEALKDAINYDKIIWNMLQEEKLTTGVTEAQLKWGYNFFKNKLNEAFALAPSKLDIALSLPSTSSDIDKGLVVVPEVLAPEDMTLDSGHYISNRTTRAIFWEANQNNRPIEFHLGDSREFLKELKDKNGKLLYEVKPFAKNYNKIYIIQYPGEATYRYAITNIGGQDRLDHLSHQISLSNLKGEQLKGKVLVKGDIKKFHASKAEEHALQLRLLPQADRVIIGQKESIDGKFNLFWKVKALKNLYDEDEAAFQAKISSLGDKDKAKFFAMMNNTSGYETLFKDKKIVEDTYALFEKEFAAKPNMVPGKFKIYNYDNFTIEMCDYVFTNSDNKTVRWRVVSNVWGDEVIPIAEALKQTGHTNVTYMGTAGAFATKGYKVGDLVSPSTVRDGENALPMQSTPMKIEGAKYGGSVEHVGSPFEESNAWLAKAQARSEFVEVETSYLRRIFNGPQDNLEIFLLISDILGSDTETLAHASSSKRKNAQNKLLAKLFERDSRGLPAPIAFEALDPAIKLKNLVFKVLEKKTAAFRYYVYSSLKNKGVVTEKEILDFAASKQSFTDSFLLDRLVKIGEVVHEIKKSYPNAGEFEVAFSKSLVEGTWNPKEEKLNIIFKAKNPQSELVLKQALSGNKKFIDDMKSYANLDVKMGIDDPNMIWMKVPEKTDPDFLVKIYAVTGFKNAGLYKNVTYNGNITLDFLPTSKAANALEAFYQGVGLVPASTKDLGGTCLQAMQRFLQLM